MRRADLGIGLALLLLAGVAACGQAGATFSTDGPCVADGRAPGTYPTLEARVPHTLGGETATKLDSGRNCSETALGALATHGVTDLRFAGATWARGNDAGTSIAVLGLPSGTLPVAWAEEFYGFGAVTGKKTDNIQTSRPSFDTVGETFRIDALNDLSLQSVLLWQDGPLVRVVIVATAVDPGASMAAHDAEIAAAVAAAAAVQVVPSPT